MPTTGEFGPRQGFGDYEEHEQLATRMRYYWIFRRRELRLNGISSIFNANLELSF